MILNFVQIFLCIECRTSTTSRARIPPSDNTSSGRGRTSNEDRGRAQDESPPSLSRNNPSAASSPPSLSRNNTGSSPPSLSRNNTGASPPSQRTASSSGARRSRSKSRTREALDLPPPPAALTSASRNYTIDESVCAFSVLTNTHIARLSMRIISGP